MDAQFILTSITTVGFPIVACGAMFWKMMKQDELHKEEMNNMTSALNNNTIALTKIMTILGKEINNEN